MTEAWMQVIAIIGSNLVIMLTFFGVTVALHLSMKDDVRAIQSEVKDFHGRLCAIEERSKGLKPESLKEKK